MWKQESYGRFWLGDFLIGENYSLHCEKQPDFRNFDVFSQIIDRTWLVMDELDA
jgi:hypothetical protein